MNFIALGALLFTLSVAVREFLDGYIAKKSQPNKKRLFFKFDRRISWKFFNVRFNESAVPATPLKRLSNSVLR